MFRSIQIFITTLLALNFLGATDLIRPKQELTPVDGGIQVKLDFQHISETQWRDLLAQPQSFHEFGYGVAGEPGEAALPMITMVIPVTVSGSIHVTALTRTEIALENPVLKSSPAGHLDSDQQAREIRNFDWGQAVRSQDNDIILGDLVNMRGQQFLPITLHPLQLDPTDRSLSITSTLEFELLGVELTETIQRTEDGGIRSISLPTDQFAPKGHYLIITTPTFESYIQYFADWKLRQGYEVTIVNTTTTGQSAYNIKAYLQGVWDTWESRPDYLVLVGDVDQGLPGHYVQNPEGDNLVTDHPYALLEGDDSFPELMVGRLSVDTISELIAFTAKIVAYESNPYMINTDWFQRALMISTTWGAASAQATKEWVADKLVENGFEQVYTAYHPAQSSASAISNPINQGVAYVNYRGYGMYNGWYGPDFTNDNIQSLIHNGSRTPVITSVVCGGGNFASYVDPCFGEKWTRIGTMNNPKGAVAFFGPSELYTHTQFNNVIDIGIYSGIFDLGLTTLGEALWHGKFELWRNYHQNTYLPFGHTPEFYHYVYNLLGDPGMQLWTDVPQLLNVEHIDTLSSGDNALVVSVTTGSGTVIPGAYVALFNDENAIGGYSDANGQIQLPFQSGTESEIMLTVTGKNLFPYLVTLPIVASDYPLSLSDWTLSADGSLVAGQTGAMDLTLVSNGVELNNVTLRFTSTTAGVTVPDIITIPNIPAGNVHVEEQVELSTDAHLGHATPVNIAVEVATGTEIWTWYQTFSVQAPQVTISALNVIDGALNAGDSAEVEIELLNMGGVPSDQVTVIPLAHNLVSFDHGSLVCPGLGVDESGDVSNTLNLIFSEQIFPGERIKLHFECIQAGLIDTLEFWLQVGEINRYGPSQVDDYGYRMFDNFDLAYTKTQAYEWVELDPVLGGSGSLINMHDTYEEGDASRVIALPFEVNYYGESYNQITVCTNGWAAFGNQSAVNFHNRTIPSPVGPDAMLAPYWDDLATNPGTVLQLTSPGQDHFVIQWNRMRNLWYQTDLSFQIIIYNTNDHPTDSGDNDIKFQYKSYDNIDLQANFSTTGIEAPDSQTGLLASYNNMNDPSIGYLANQTALLFTTDRGERLADGMAAVNTTSLSFTQNPWSTGRDSIIISNVGESPLAYNIHINSTSDLMLAPQIIVDPTIHKATPDEVADTPGIREGSDAFGYTWKKSIDEGGPDYNWVDIAIPPNILNYTADPDDSSIGPVSLGFEFPYYGDVYSGIHISSNGTFSFMSNYAPWLNTVLPTASAPSALVAPWWEDLNNDEGPQGTIYFWTNNYDQCIITWQDFPKWGTSNLYTFQVIMDAFGKIIFQYQTIDGPTTSATVGMQNAARNIGLQIHYNETTTFAAETAISILPPVQWFAASGWSGQIAPGASSSFVVDVQTRNLDPGHYEIPMILTTSAINFPMADLLVSLDIITGQPPAGDLNGDYLINITDLMSLLDFILVLEDMSEAQFMLADLSADNTVDVIDVILLVETILENN
ncbi:MAG: C25 family cysteine peptidase [Candidatus Marinimicrobia bacterium]|nr:C25 family cysteine peptidase [Candidatus Neomarinimicrobiota bacterium]